MKINLGCSDRFIQGFLNVDIVNPAEQIVDLREPWPWQDSTVDEILALDIIEHLPDKIHTMNEIWRVLVSGGIVKIEVPTTDGPGAWQDPTHCSYWNRNSFMYHDVANPHFKRFHKSLGLLGGFKIVNEKQWMAVDNVPKLRMVMSAVK